VDLDIHPDAEEEAALAGEWYAVRNPTAGERFRGELTKAIRRAFESPDRWPRYLGKTRAVKLRRFPYVVVYRDFPTSVKIVAVAHTSRKPGYWKRRLR
jgi:plasmid stabilization system protein ParE